MRASQLKYYGLDKLVGVHGQVKF